MARITIEDCEKFVDNRFELVALAALRARQLINGDTPKIVPKEGEKRTVIALREIGEGALLLGGLHEDLVNGFRTVNFSDEDEEEENFEEDTYNPYLGISGEQAENVAASEAVKAEVIAPTVDADVDTIDGMSVVSEDELEKESIN